MEWKISPSPVPYPDAVEAMEKRVEAIAAAQADELIWLLEHPALYTAGSSAQESDLVDALGFPVFNTGRGGQYTYHGPGQRVGYVMLDLKRRTQDIRLFVHQLEGWIIATLATFGIQGERREGRIGIWVTAKDGSEAKIAALGIRVRKWITYHGVSINLNPDLTHYRGIVPCGIKEYGVTSFAQLGVQATMEELDERLKINFPEALKL